MSYIIKCADAFVSIKLTEIGREKLSQGRLNFSFWGAGDSEVNYDRETIVEDNLTDPALSGTSNILRPKDRQPNIKTYVYGGTEVLNPLPASSIQVGKIVANNEAKERGFFSATTSGYTTMVTDRYVKDNGTIAASNFTGTDSLTATVSADIGDWIMFKFSNDDTPVLVPGDNTTPTPNLWYKIQVSGPTMTLDRNLPDLSSESVDIEYFVYPQGEVYDAFGLSAQTAYWDTGTLSFNSSCNVTLEDVPVWNMNIPFSENILGLSGTTTQYEGFERFGSYEYLGTMDPYLEYKLNVSSDDGTDVCGGISNLDKGNKNIAILHYTNKTISNLYGEFFFIDNHHDKTVKLHLPTLMYHRREFSGSSTGDIMGMDFIASGDVKTIGNSNIEYVDLIEEPTLIGSGMTPMAIGKVFPQLKIVVIDDAEIVTAMSYKSNRNWTLPTLSVNLTAPTSGANSGILEASKTMYLTYIIENSGMTGCNTALPCQKYSKITNGTSSSRNLEFRLEGIDLLPYMRKIEDPGYDGMGFYGDTFKVLYQIVDNPGDRPESDAWLEADFTSDAITVSPGETILPTALENQSPITNGFVMSTGTTSGATLFNIIDVLNMPLQSNYDNLNFGDERFFYGNLEAFIGATTYKTIFDIRMNSANFNKTTNPTRSQDPTTNPTNIRVSEVGIYDEDKELVVIGKLMTPVEIINGNTIMIELSIDF